MPTYRYLEETHQYFADYPDGRTEEYIGVTALLDYHGLVSEYSKNREAALRGTRAHEACRYLAEKRLDWTSVDPQIEGYVKSLEQWIALTGFVTEGCEQQRFSDPLKLGGTFDWKGHTPTGAKYLIDWKCGVSQPWHRIQTALYMILEGEYRRRASLYLRRNGKIAHIKLHDDENDILYAHSLITVRHLKESINGK